MSDAVELWDAFVRDGTRDSDALDRGVSALRPDTLHQPEHRHELRALSYHAFSIATQSLLLGDEHIGKLAIACERCMELLTEHAVAAEHVLPLLSSGAYTLRQAFASLAAADRSGARADARPLEAARFELEAAFPQSSGSRSPATLAQSQAPDVPVDALRRRPQPATSAPEPRDVSGEAAPGHAISQGPGQEIGEANAEPGADVWVPSVPEDMVDLFFDEVDERVEGLSLTLIDVEQRPDDNELLRSVFRDLHTLKGSSAMVGLQPMNKLAHAAEDLVGQLRDGERKADGAIIDALLAALDGLRDIAALARAGQPLALSLSPILDHLRNPHGGQSHAAAHPVDHPTAGGPGRLAADSSAPAAADAGARGERSLPALGHAARQTIRVDFDKLDRLMNLVGELVLGRDGLRTALQALSSVADELSSERLLTRRINTAHRGLAQRVGTHVGLGNTRSAVAVHRREHPMASTLRDLSDELGRVERVLIDIAQDLGYATGKLDSVSDDLRDQVMKLRMVPIGGVFRKHHRTVRDLAASLGKQARLQLFGEDTELDKLLVEALDEPLMHLVRNAVDHGIESPAARVAAGKPLEGIISLSASHRGNQMVVQIADDGKGIDPDALRAKVRERALLSEEQLSELDEHQILDVIFRPGFSTAATVSQVSGRGVGMDVVRQIIVTRLKGTIDIDSVHGRGTSFTLRLPLTLAIIQVLLARAGGEVFAIPLGAVTRTISCAPESIQLVQDREVLAVRGRQLPLIRLTNVLELGSVPYPPDTALQVVITELGNAHYGLVCDHLIGKKEIVIKPLGDLLHNVPCAAGATILGERCALILDVPAIIHRALHASPLVTKLASASPRSGARVAPGSRAAHVLLVDDSDTVRESLRRLITEAGYRCTTAGDGVEGLAEAMRGKYDLVSTDVVMPRMDGYELTRRLRATIEYRDTPIVMVTSRGERIDRVRGFDAGVDEYITKPHDRQLLLRTIRTLLAQRDSSTRKTAAHPDEPEEQL